MNLELSSINSFDKEELQVICEGRKIGFQIDPTVGMDVTAVMGKVVEIDIRNIPTATNGLANLNLDEESTSFFLIVDNMNCEKNARDNLFSDNLRNEIASILTIGPSRIDIQGEDCVQSKLQARVQIHASSRRFLRIASQNLERIKIQLASSINYRTVLSLLTRIKKVV